MTLYTIAIDSVDTVSSFTCTSDRKATVLDFLNRYDHEGSCVVLVEVIHDEVSGVKFEREFDAEQAYARLATADAPEG